MNTQIITGQKTRRKPTQSFDGIVMKGNSNIMSPVRIELPGRWEMWSGWAVMYNCNSTFTERQKTKLVSGHPRSLSHTPKALIVITVRQAYGYYFFFFFFLLWFFGGGVGFFFFWGGG